MFGCKDLIPDLHALCFSVSYGEVRGFLTSAAISQIDNNIPPHFLNSDVLIDGAIDNFDQNEFTLDGKRTTRSMAIVLYKRCKHHEPANHQIARAGKKTLSGLDVGSAHEVER